MNLAPLPGERRGRTRQDKRLVVLVKFDALRADASITESVRAVLDHGLAGISGTILIGGWLCHWWLVRRTCGKRNERSRY
jgi:ammonia channel protein AmtB